MCKSRQTTRRQLAVIEDLFAGELDEQAVLNKHGVKPAVYRKWLADEQFMTHFERRLAQAYHSTRLRLARNAVAAAKRLVELAQCQQTETARKACLDILFPPHSSNETSENTRRPTVPEPTANLDPALSPETASRVLAILAENMQSTRSGS
jgi:hypothetical protein